MGLSDMHDGLAGYGAMFSCPPPLLLAGILFSQHFVTSLHRLTNERFNNLELGFSKYSFIFVARGTGGNSFDHAV
jgi:hypothetical protein